MTTDHPAPGRLAEILSEAIGRLGTTQEPQDVPDYLELIEVTAGVESEARVLLQDAVDAARSAGATWSAVGRTLGMSKQAAQKRFATPPAPTGSDLGPDERILGPVTAFEEMAELELAGRYGWYGVSVGPLFHRVLRSTTQWEHKRVSMLTRSRREAMQADGWQVIASSFPYTYLRRDRGTPALTEPDRPSPAPPLS